MDRTQEYIRQAQKGSQEAKEILLQENAGLIWNIVKRFYGRGYDPEAVSYTHLDVYKRQIMMRYSDFPMPVPHFQSDWNPDMWI